jgi:AcrR family transcriptional regulator
MAVKERVRVGGRSARIQAEVHKAVKELQREADRAELTVPLIANRAGVTPSTIYRRWGDLTELLADVAVERLRPTSEPEDTGSMMGDLHAFLEQYMEEFASPVGRELLQDLMANASDAPYTGQCCAFTYDSLRTIALRAEKRGETPIDSDEIIDHAVAPIMYRILFGGHELTTDYCRSLVDGLVSREKPASSH